MKKNSTQLKNNIYHKTNNNKPNLHVNTNCNKDIEISQSSISNSSKQIDRSNVTKSSNNVNKCYNIKPITSKNNSTLNNKETKEVNLKSIKKETYIMFDNLKINLILTDFFNNFQIIRSNKINSPDKFTIDLFYSHLNNHKSKSAFTVNLSSLFQQIIYFLLTSLTFEEYVILDKNSSNNIKLEEYIINEYMFCYPVTTLIESKNFKDKTYIIIKKLEELSIIEDNIIVGKNVLDNPHGDRAIELLYKLSNKLLQCKIIKLQKLNNANFDSDIRSLNNITNIFKKNLTKDINIKILNTHIGILSDGYCKIINNIDLLQNQSKTLYTNLHNQEEELDKEIEEYNKKINIKIKELGINSINNQEDDISAISRMVNLDNYKIYIDNIYKISNALDSEHVCINNKSINGVSFCLSDLVNIKHKSLKEKLEDINSNDMLLEDQSLENRLSNVMSNIKSNKDIVILHEEIKNYNNNLNYLYDNNNSFKKIEELLTNLNNKILQNIK